MLSVLGGLSDGKWNGRGERSGKGERGIRILRREGERERLGRKKGRRS